MQPSRPERHGVSQGSGPLLDWQDNRLGHIVRRWKEEVGRGTVDRHLLASQEPFSSPPIGASTVFVNKETEAQGGG